MNRPGIGLNSWSHHARYESAGLPKTMFQLIAERLIAQAILRHKHERIYHKLFLPWKKHTDCLLHVGFNMLHTKNAYCSWSIHSYMSTTHQLSSVIGTPTSIQKWTKKKKNRICWTSLSKKAKQMCRNALTWTPLCLPAYVFFPRPTRFSFSKVSCTNI